jgi:hypothetical protein
MGASDYPQIYRSGFWVTVLLLSDPWAGMGWVRDGLGVGGGRGGGGEEACKPVLQDKWVHNSCMTYNRV